jgi:hypothetical protein
MLGFVKLTSNIFQGNLDRGLGILAVFALLAPTAYAFDTYLEEKLSVMLVFPVVWFIGIIIARVILKRKQKEHRWTETQYLGRYVLAIVAIALLLFFVAGIIASRW